MDRCPRHDQCQHGSKLVVNVDGSCRDCGTQIAHPDLYMMERRKKLRGKHLRWPQYSRDSTPDLWERLVSRSASQISL